MMMNLTDEVLRVENTLKPKKGRILISEPFSQDAFFKRSLVFLTEYNAKGALGFILNRPLKMQVNDMIKGFPDFESVVSIGGPVNTDSLFFLHTLGDKIPGSTHIINDFYWGGNLSLLKKLAQNTIIKPEEVRFFVGYSGWQPQQLDNEIANNYWVVSKKIPQDLMTINDSKSWSNIIESMGEKYKVWANSPDNPAYN